ncbi:3788_t:CDS:1 [Acaulospora morrowiae]|uniref:3788_t:CDS:1 n=1 Tax=Acaulospora morrowiae TaxID=94023 RepID=A0A9N9CCU9_9GLOM|nr:3788_t:CDS:1 [Acaulospora morrowiae]
MRNSLATPSSPGFSYLFLFKKEYHTYISGGLGPSPTVLEVFSLFTNNDLIYRTDLHIKPTKLDDAKLVTIESGRPPSKPERRQAGWDGDVDEGDEEYNARVERWRDEYLRWFEVEDFMYRISDEHYLEYKFG